MTLKKAIVILNTQLEKLEYSSNRNDEWIYQTASYIKDFFGENSVEYNFISKFNFGIIASNWDSDEDISYRLAQKPIKVKNFIENCIETLNDKGIYAPPKNNFITRMPEGWAIFWFSTILLVWSVFCYGIGVYQTQNKVDREKIDMKNKIDSLLRVTQSFIINSNKSPNNSASKSIYTKPNKNH